MADAPHRSTPGRPGRQRLEPEAVRAAPAPRADRPTRTGGRPAPPAATLPTGAAATDAARAGRPRPPRPRRRPPTPTRPPRSPRRPSPTATRLPAAGCGPGWPGSAPSGRARQPGARAAVPRRPPDPPQGRPAAARAGLRRRRAAAPRPDAQVRRPVHHPPARRRHDPGRAGHGRRPRCARRCCTTRSRTPTYTLEQLRARLRRRGRAPRRRRHQARQGQATARRRRPRPSARWSSRWPATPGCWSSSWPTGCTTCARCATSSRRQAGAEGPRDAGDLRPAGPPARHEHDQVGAGGPRLRDALPEGLRRDRPAGRRAGAQPRRLPGRRHRAGQRRPASGAKIRGDGHRPAEALLLDLPEDDRARPRLRRHLRPGRHPDPGRLGPRLLRGARRDPRALEAGPGPVQGLHRDAQVQHVPVAAHDGHRARGQAGRAADPHLRDAPPRRVRHRRALEVQGGRRRRRPSDGAPRRAGRDRRPARSTTWPGCASCWTGRRRPRTRASSWRRLRFDLVRARSTSSRPRATSSRCRPGRPRSTSPTRCTPRSATAASAPGSTAGWCRWSARSTTATWSRSSPPRPQGAGPSRDWLTFVKSPRARNKIRAVVLQGAPRGGDRARQGRDRQGDAQAEPADPAAAHRRVADHARPRAALPRRLRALRRDRREPRLARSPSCSRLVESLGGEEGADRGHRRGHRARRAGRGGAAPRDPGVVVKGAADVWVKLARCCTPVPGRRDRRLRHPRQRRLGAPRRLRQRGRAAGAARADGRGRVGAVGRPRCSWSRSRSRRWTGPGCCPTSPGCCPTSTSTSCRRRSRRPATGWRSRGSPSRWATPSTSATCCSAVRGVDGVFDVYRVTSGKA